MLGRVEGIREMGFELRFDVSAKISLGWEKVWGPIGNTVGCRNGKWDIFLTSYVGVWALGGNLQVPLLKRVNSGCEELVQGG